MKKNQFCSIKEWLPIQKIFEKGIIQLKNQTFIKIIKIIPINYHLKSDLEKEAILNSYKTFLKTCNFDFQIFIQSNKEDLSEHIKKIENEIKYQKNLNLIKLSQNYIQFIQKINQQKNSSSKNFYIIIKKSNFSKQMNQQEIIFQELNENYFKIKECLARAGNIALSIEDKENVEKIFFEIFHAPINIKEETTLCSK